MCRSLMLHAMDLEDTWILRKNYIKTSNILKYVQSWQPAPSSVENLVIKGFHH